LKVRLLSSEVLERVAPGTRRNGTLPILIALAIVTGHVFVNFAHGSEPPRVTYDEKIVPLLRERCFACHGPTKKSSGLRLDTYAAVMTGGSSGEAIKPGDPDGSLLYRLITHKDEPHMPPRSPMLPKENLDLVRAWIEAGALENTGSKAKVASKPKFEMAPAVGLGGKPKAPPAMPVNLPLDPVTVTQKPNTLGALAASPWSPLVAIGGQRQVLLYDSQLLDFLGILPFPEGTPKVLKFSRDGTLLLAGGGQSGKSGRVVIWGVSTGKRVFEVGDETDEVLAADQSTNQELVALGGPGKIIRIYNTRDGKQAYELKKHTDWITTLEFSPDGVLLATGDRAGNLFVWEARTGREYLSLRGHTAAITDVTWMPDANVVASASEDGTIRLWEMENGTQVRNWSAGAGLESLRYAMDGRLVSTGRDRLVRVWDGNGGALGTIGPLPDIATRAVFGHDGGRLFAGDWTGQVGVWSTIDWKNLGQFDVTPGPVAERLVKAIHDLSAREAANQQASQQAAGSQAAALAATAELNASRQMAADTATAADIVATEVKRAKATAEQADLARSRAQEPVTAREAILHAFTEAVAKIAEASQRTPDNKDLQAALQKSQKLVADAQTDLLTAQKSLAPFAAAATKASEHYAAAQRAAVVTKAAAQETVKILAAREATAKTALAKAAADKESADAAAKGLASCRRLIERCQKASAHACSK
jgi:hypothetical protein